MADDTKPVALLPDINRPRVLQCPARYEVVPPLSRIQHTRNTSQVTLLADAVACVAGKPRFYGAPGIRNGNTAVRVDDRH